MDDLISRQMAIDALGDEPEVWTGKDEYAQGLNNQWHYDRNALIALPSAQPEDYAHGFADGYKQGQKDAHPERKTGEWKRRLVDSGFNADWHCSECGWKTALEEHGYNYCPSCGADMRGDNNVDNN